MKNTKRLGANKDGRALHSASSVPTDVDANRPFAGMEFNKRRSTSAKPTARQAPWDQTDAQYARVENVPRSFHTYREPQQSTRFGQPRNNSFSRCKDRIFLMRLPSEPGCVCALPCCHVA